VNCVFVYAVVHGINIFQTCRPVQSNIAPYIYLPQRDLYVYSRCCGTQYLYVSRALFTLLYYSPWSGVEVWSTVHGIRCRVEPEASSIGTWKCGAQRSELPFECARCASSGSACVRTRLRVRGKMLSYRRTKDLRDHVDAVAVWVLMGLAALAQ
jgi:hypothetical protein